MAHPIATVPANGTLGKARSAKNDEFYTRLSDIESELRHYRSQLRGKVVLCNCDDPYESNFFRYFALNFNQLGLKKLIATSYPRSAITGKLLPLFDIEGLKPEGKDPYAIEICEVPDHKEVGATDLADVEYLLKNDANTCRTLLGDGKYEAGDFRSSECVDYLRQSDVVVTNPPFSLFREYLGQLTENNKSFIIIANKNSVTYKEVFSLIKSNKLWSGVRPFSGGMWFISDYEGKYERIEKGVKQINVPAIWLTNMDNPKRHEDVPLFRFYTPEEYPYYDNYDVIEVGKVADIPIDYDGVMGVPITYLDKYNPNQFDIVGLAAGNIRGLAGVPSKTGKDGPYINGKLKYGRIFIRRVR